MVTLFHYRKGQESGSQGVSEWSGEEGICALYTSVSVLFFYHLPTYKVGLVHLPTCKVGLVHLPTCKVG